MSKNTVIIYSANPPDYQYKHEPQLETLCSCSDWEENISVVPPWQSVT
uniref:Uncharacterized protein n=1 Tax=Anguilla anguilla TaxID=7936 RepID=A0A0E9RMF2_ANGAN